MRDARGPNGGERRHRGGNVAALALAALCSLSMLTLDAALGGGAEAQQGFVAGLVQDGRSLEPLAGAQIVVEGTTLGTITDERGRFRIQGLSGTEVTLAVHLIGYRTTVEDVRVGDPGIVLQLQQSAVSLDEIVVTGTPGGTQKRALGNTLATVKADEVQELAPAPDVTGLLRGRASSVSITPSSGMAGSGSRVRIRGVNSLSLDSDPLIYVDGVRIDNSERTQPGAGGGDTSGNWGSLSRLSDIDPNQIESIEVIKGPAAATLYGTEASNGVIQIITKKGVQGRPQVTLSVQQGANWVHDPEGRFNTYYRRNADGSVFEFNPVQSETARGTPIFSNGHVQRYDMEVSGGAESVRYFLSGGYTSEQGVVQPNEVDRYNIRGNVNATLSDELDVAANLGYQTGRTDINREGGGTMGFAWWPCMSTACHADGRGLAISAAPEDFLRTWEEYEDGDQFTGGLTVNYRPLEWLSNRLVVGRDQALYEAHSLAERQSDPRLLQVFGADALGRHNILERQVETTTVDYAGTLDFDLPRAINSKTSVGFQYYKQFTDTRGLLGQEFPASGVSAINAAARVTGTGTFTEAATVGTYVQQQFSLNDRLFLTAAIRADDNSAFGEDFDLVTYPKVSAAWVVSEEPFWSLDFLSTLRLRAAYGESGKQPVNFAALRIYQPTTAPGGVSGVRPLSLGNPDLGPERGAEIEAGLDASLFQERIGVEFTFYDKRTKDVILNRPVPPSLGFTGTQPVNIGEVRNTGLEFTINALALQRDNFVWDLGLTAGYNENEIEDMGGVAPISIVTQQHREGYPVAAFFGQKVVSADVSAEGVVTNVLCDGGTGESGLDPGGAAVPCAGAPAVYLGKPMPTWEGSLSSTMTLFDRLNLYAMIDYQFDVEVFDWSERGQCQSSLQCAINVFPEERVANPILAGEYSFFHFGGALHPDRSYARLRQVSASYRVPERFAGGLGASAATVTLTARNLPALWRPTDYTGMDPDATSRYTGGNYHYAINFIPTPLSMQFVAGVRVTF